MDLQHNPGIVPPATLSFTWGPEDTIPEKPSFVAAHFLNKVWICLGPGYTLGQDHKAPPLYPAKGCLASHQQGEGHLV